MAEMNNQDLDAHRLPSSDSVDAADDVPEPVRRYWAAVDRLIESRLSDDEVEARLRRLLEVASQQAGVGSEPTFEDPAWHAVRHDLAQYGYPLVRVWLEMVRIWLRGAAAMAAYPHDLTDDDLDAIAQETVARAINKMRDEALQTGQGFGGIVDERRVAFLSQCVCQLPRVYRSRVRRTEPLTVAGFEEIKESGKQLEPAFLHALRNCVTERRGHNIRLLEEWGKSSEEAAAILDITLRALDHAAHQRSKAVGGPQTSLGTPDDRGSNA